MIFLPLWMSSWFSIFCWKSNLSSIELLCYLCKNHLNVYGYSVFSWPVYLVLYKYHKVKASAGLASARGPGGGSVSHFLQLLVAAGIPWFVAALLQSLNSLSPCFLGCCHQNFSVFILLRYLCLYLGTAWVIQESLPISR